MKYTNINQLIDNWLIFSEEEIDSPIFEEYFWAFSEVSELIRIDPTVAWEFLQKTCAREMSERQEMSYACGPLEKFIHDHGSNYIDEIEAFASDNPKMSELLGGVWHSDTVTPEVWKRIEILRGEPWGP